MRRARSIPHRLVLLVLGAGLVLAGASVLFEVGPASPTAVRASTVTLAETIHYWTPDSGWQQAGRLYETRLYEGAHNLTREERIIGPHSPRGDLFTFEVDADLRVLSEPGVRADFSPHAGLADVPSTVYIGVPWATRGQSAVGAIDRFELVGRESLDGTRALRYEARHGEQFFVSGETVWFRAAIRTAWVDPKSGLRLDYRDHEIIWSRPLTDVPLINLPAVLAEQVTPREKVWEAIVTPTDASRESLQEQASAYRQGQTLRQALWGVPLVAVGEMMLWGALVNRGSTGRRSKRRDGR